MSLALARTHAPGQPEYVLAHSLWVKRTPTCVSGRGSGRGEVALLLRCPETSISKQSSATGWAPTSLRPAATSRPSSVAGRSGR